MPGADASTPTPHNLPRPNPYFTGREALLAHLRQQLLDNRMAELRGMGGIGKTTTALEYAWRFHGDYGFIGWLPAEDPTVLAEGFAGLAPLLGLETDPIAERRLVINQVKQRLAEQGNRAPDRVLLVFDNVERFAHIEDYLPAPGWPGHALITARNPAAALVRTALSPEAFTIEEAGEFIEGPPGPGGPGRPGGIGGGAGRPAAGPGTGPGLHGRDRGHGAGVSGTLPGASPRAAGTRRRREPGQANGGRDLYPRLRPGGGGDAGERGLPEPLRLPGPGGDPLLAFHPGRGWGRGACRRQARAPSRTRGRLGARCARPQPPVGGGGGGPPGLGPVDRRAPPPRPAHHERQEPRLPPAGPGRPGRAPAGEGTDGLAGPGHSLAGRGLPLRRRRIGPPAGSSSPMSRPCGGRPGRGTSSAPSWRVS